MGRGTRSLNKESTTAKALKGMKTRKFVPSGPERIHYHDAFLFDPNGLRESTNKDSWASDYTEKRLNPDFNNSGTATFYGKKLSLQRHANNIFDDREFLSLRLQLEHMEDFVDSDNWNENMRDLSYEASDLYSMLGSGNKSRALLARAVIDERRRTFYRVKDQGCENSERVFDRDKVKETLKKQPYVDLKDNTDRWLARNWDGGDMPIYDFQRESLYQIITRRNSVEKLNPEGSFQDILKISDYFLKQVRTNKFNWDNHHDVRPDLYVKALSVVEGSLSDEESRKEQEVFDKLLPELREIASVRGAVPITPSIIYPNNGWANFNNSGIYRTRDPNFYGHIMADKGDGLIFIQSDWAQKAIRGDSYTTPVHELIHSSSLI